MFFLKIGKMIHNSQSVEHLGTPTLKQNFFAVLLFFL